MGKRTKETEDRDGADALAFMNVSQAAIERLKIYEQLLRKWQRVENLVAPKTLDQVWRRHFADSAQVLDVAGTASRWVDLGSGAGFPGMVVAILLAERGGCCVHVIESNHRKCAFLREVSRETSAPALVHHGRIEAIVPTLQTIEAVTARALAPLPVLLDYADPLLKTGAIGVFLKGETAAAELTNLPPSDNFRFDFVTSKTNTAGRLIVVQRQALSPASP